MYDLVYSSVISSITDILVVNKIVETPCEKKTLAEYTTSVITATQTDHIRLHAN